MAIESKVVYVQATVTDEGDGEYTTNARRLTEDMERTIHKLNSEGYNVVSVMPMPIGIGLQGVIITAQKES